MAAVNRISGQRKIGTRMDQFGHSGECYRIAREAWATVTDGGLEIFLSDAGIPTDSIQPH